MLHEGFGLEQRLRPQDLTSFLTPEADLFSVRHLGIPDFAGDTWRLAIGGAVTRQLHLSLDDLRALPQTEITSVHECAGSPLAPAVPQRRMGNVRWGGVRLGELLDLGVPALAESIIRPGKAVRAVYRGPTGWALSRGWCSLRQDDRPCCCDWPTWAWRMRSPRCACYQ
ncbi:molybdopterin-dependent oxidoreductase [Streptomyces malaysiensis]|uniref:molybdopterin-dependent oxidoreductase n=1 Tax=Streptomyces malaysiensis TaxID=92644 RepID=UPI003D2F7308|nr:molybdopterin-dependent oxidoreductase [Streptomyces malaysiensis]